MTYTVLKMRLTLLSTVLVLAAIGCSPASDEQPTLTPTLSPSDIQAEWERRAPGISIPSRESIECMMERASLPGASPEDILELPSRNAMRQRSAALYYPCLSDEEASAFYSHLDPSLQPYYPPSLQRCTEEQVSFEEFFRFIALGELEGGVFPQWFIGCIPRAEGAPPLAGPPPELGMPSEETAACMEERVNLLGADPLDVLELPWRHPMRQRFAALLYACYTDDYASELYSYRDPSGRPDYPPSFQRCAEEQVGFEEFLRYMTTSDEEAERLGEFPDWVLACAYLIPP